MNTEIIYRESEFNETLNLYLADARRRAAISLETVAAQIGVSPEYLESLEHSDTPLTAFQARKISDIVGVSITPFFENNTNKYPCSVFNLNYFINILTRILDKLTKN